MCLQVPILHGSRYRERATSTGTGKEAYFDSAYCEYTSIPTHPSLGVILISFRESKETSMWDCGFPVSVPQSRKRHAC
jgi:hypothetical protein